MKSKLFDWKQNAVMKIVLVVCMFLLLGLDQWTKYLAVAKLKGTAGCSILKDVFSLQYLENYGAAFGVMQNKRWLLLCITIVILLALIWVFVRIPSKRRYLPLQICIILLGAGAIGNIIDRMFHGFVIDMLYFELINFPIFNVADCYVVISAILAFFLICFYYKEDELAIFKKGNK